MNTLSEDFFADDAVTMAAAALEAAIAVAVEKRGLKLKGLTLVANTKERTGVMSSGCHCPSCLINILQSVAEAYGGKAEVTELGIEHIQVH